MTLSLTLEPIYLKRWTVRDYHRMSESGVLDPNQRTELLAGQIAIMAPKGTAHVTALHLLANSLRNQLGASVLVRTQDPITLNDFSEPEPDIAIVQGTILDYADHHPYPDEVVLIVEVADSTVKQDCEVKTKLYGNAGIKDYWVLDVNKRQLHIFRHPTPTGYTQHLILSEPDRVSPIAFPQLSLTLASMLPPVTT